MASLRSISFIVATAFFMETLDSTIIATSLPAMAADLGARPVVLSLAITAYLAALAIFIPASGWFGDRFGPRRIFIVAIVVFILGSIGSAMAVDIATLTAARFVQGTGGAMMVPVGRLLVLRTADRGDLVAIMVWMTMPALLAPMIGPPLGGFITTYVHWRWVFWINVPIGLAGIVAALVYMPKLAPQKNQRFDLKGFLLLALGLAALLLGLTIIGDDLAPTWTPPVLTLGGAAFLVLYSLHARREENAIIDLGLFRFLSLRSGIIGGMVFRAAAGALPFLLPLLLQVGFGYTPFGSGLILLAVASGGFLTMMFAERTVLRFGFRTVIIVNACLYGLTSVGVALFSPETALSLMVMILLAGGIFRALHFTALNALIFDDVPEDELARATSLASAAQHTSICVGVAVGTLVLDLTRNLAGSEALELRHFPPVFLLVAATMGLSALFFVRLPAKAGRQSRSDTPTNPVIPSD